jgi:hypothetical protein
MGTGYFFYKKEESLYLWTVHTEKGTCPFFSLCRGLIHQAHLLILQEIIEFEISDFNVKKKQSPF